MYTSVYNL